MATSGLDLSLQLNASQRGLSEIQADVSSLVQQFHNATRAIGQVGDLSQLSGESLRQMAQYGQQSLSRLETELAAARLELNRLAATNATPTDIENARQRVEQLTRAVDQTRTAVGAYEDAARAAMETPPVPTDFQRRVGSLVNQLENVGRTLDQNGNSATHTRQQLEQLATQATEQLRRYEQQLNDARLELNRLSATSASPADIERARNRVQELERGISQVSGALDGYRSRARIANNDVASSTNRATESVDRLRSSYGLLRTTVTTLAASLATLGVGLSVKSLADTADSYTNLSARIRISIGDTGNFAQAMAGVHQSALMTNSSLDATAQLYVKINDVGKTMGLNQQQSLDLTNTINMAIKNGGGAAASTEAALYQFNQGLQSSVLRGDEFNSVMEQAPGLAKALANGLGVTAFEMRKMAEEGKLTSSTVIKALQSQSKAVRDEFGKFPPTIGNAVQRIKSQWEILIGTMNQSNGASKTVAQWMITIADNMGVVEQLLKDVGSGFVWIGDKLSKIDVATIQALKDALISAYDVLKTMLSTVGDVALSVVDGFSSAADAILGFSSGAEEAESKTNGFTKVLQVINVALGLLSDGFRGIGISVKLFTGLLYDMASAWFQVKSKFTWGDVRKQAIADMEAMQKKAREYYTSAGNDADKFESKAKIAYDNIGKTQQQRNNESVASAKDAMDKIIAVKEVEQSKTGDIDARITASNTKLNNDKISAVQDYVNAAMAANKGVLDGTVQADLLTKGYIVTVDEAGKATVKAWTDAKASTQEQAAAIQKAKDAENEYNTFVQNSAAKRVEINQQIVAAKASGDLTALNSAKQALAQIDVEEQKLLEKKKLYALQAQQAASSSNAGVISAAKESATALGIDLDAALGKLSRGFATGKEQVDNLAKGMNALGATGSQAAEIVYAGWLKWLGTAKSQTEIDAAKAKLQEFGQAGKLSTQQVDAGLLAIKLRAAELPSAIDPVTQAFEALGIKTKEQLALSAQQSLASFNTILSSGKATASGLKSAYEQVMQAAVASGDQAVIAAAKSKAAQAGLNVEISNTGDVTVKTTREIVDASSQTVDSVDAILRSTTRASNSFQNLGDTATDQANKVKDAWDSAADSVSNAAKAGEKVTASNLWLTQDYIEQQLKSQGYDDSKAKSLASKIYNQTKGQSNTGAAYASRDYYLSHGYDNSMYAQMRTGSKNISNYAAVDEQLQKYAEKAAKQSKTTTDTTSSAAASTETKASKTVRYEIVNGQRKAVLYGDSAAGTDLEGVMSQLETLKKAGA